MNKHTTIVYYSKKHVKQHKQPLSSLLTGKLLVWFWLHDTQWKTALSVNGTSSSLH